MLFTLDKLICRFVKQFQALLADDLAQVTCALNYTHPILQLKLCGGIHVVRRNEAECVHVCAFICGGTSIVAVVSCIRPQIEGTPAQSEAV